MVDTIKCGSELDLTHQFFEKLLLGAIDKRLDQSEMETHDPTQYGQDTYHAMPDHPKAPSKGKEQQSSDDEHLVGSSNRGKSLQENRSSTMSTLVGSLGDAAQVTHTLEDVPSNRNSFRHSSPPSTGYGPPRRHTGFNNAIQEAEEPEPEAPQRSSTSASHQSHQSRWWKPSIS